MFSRHSRVLATGLYNNMRNSAKRFYNKSMNPAALQTTITGSPKALPDPETLVFGHTFSDHMLEVNWDEDNGWHAPVIRPYANFSISPAASVLHYGLECFEGMKAYKDKNGDIRMFRPDRNMARLNFSMETLEMPSFHGEDFIECMKELLRIDKAWVPEGDGYSIYLRPTAIATNEALGVTRSNKCKLYVICSPVGPYYKSGFKPIKLYADTTHVRAWPGGTGNAKLGGNYGPTIKHSWNCAKDHGCQQVLWLFGPDRHVTEVGAMNIFFVIDKKDGSGPELITAPLTRGDILPGVTRASILELAKEWGKLDVTGLKGLTVSERFVSMAEVCEAEKEGRLLESFGAGTAVIVSPVESILYEGQTIQTASGDKIGPVAQHCWNTLTDIQYGRKEHEWSVLV